MAHPYQNIQTAFIHEKALDESESLLKDLPDEDLLEDSYHSKKSVNTSGSIEKEMIEDPQELNNEQQEEEKALEAIVHEIDQSKSSVNQKSQHEKVEEPQETIQQNEALENSYRNERSYISKEESRVESSLHDHNKSQDIIIPQNQSLGAEKESLREMNDLIDEPSMGPTKEDLKEKAPPEPINDVSREKEQPKKVEQVIEFRESNEEIPVKKMKGGKSQKQYDTCLVKGDSQVINKIRIQISWKNITIQPKKGKNKKKILNNVSGILEPGSFLAIIGASGAGKTTLMNFLSGKMFPASLEKTEGEVYINGIPRDEIDYSQFTAYVQQDDVLFETLSVFGI